MDNLMKEEREIFKGRCKYAVSKRSGKCIGI